MKGDFRPDITRDTFRLYRHFSRVLMQQGRVQLDSDWNEQVDILLHYLRTFVADMIGSHGGPGDGFKIGPYTSIEQEQEKARRPRAKTPELKEVPYHLLVHKGHYYVNGFLCENDDDDFVFRIPSSLRPTSAPSGPAQRVEAGRVVYFLYLDVWEREVTYLEDSSIREVALGGPDTTTRAQVVWRVRAIQPKDTGTDAPDPKKYQKQGQDFDLPGFIADWTKHLHTWKSVDPGRLQAKAIDAEESSREPRAIPPTSQYRGMENQLYRVEIHEGSATSSGPTFKWSRENGAVMFPIIGSISGGNNLTSLSLTVGNLGRDDSRFGLNVDDWVEIVDTEEALEGEPGPIMRVESIDYASRKVTLASASENGVTLDPDRDPERTLFLRRWDYHEGDPADTHTTQITDSGALKIVDGWLTLENGIQILFDHENRTRTYRTGDYWLIPARTATGKIEWPRHHNQPEALPPHGVEHFYAPLAYITLAEGKVDKNESHDLRHTL